VFFLVSTVGGMDLRDRDGGTWKLLTGHGRVLVEIARNSRARVRDIAAAAGLAERAPSRPSSPTWRRRGTCPAAGPAAALSMPSTPTARSGIPPRPGCA
jgi:hypothetical protein